MVAEVHFRQPGANGFHVKGKNKRFTAAGSSCCQKCGNATSSFIKLRQRIALESMSHVQHDYFFSFTNHIISFVTSYLHSAELSLSGSDKKCKCFLFGMRRTSVSRHSCSLLCLAYLRFGSCNVQVSHLSSGTFNFYLKDSFMFESPIILQLLLAPKGCCVCISLGDTFPFFPLDWLLVL